MVSEYVHEDYDGDIGDISYYDDHETLSKKIALII